MDLGSLPGYYYDTEKRKYFKIQPGHKLPVKDVKYERSNVKREHRSRALQKKEKKQTRKVLTARPRLAAALRFTGISGTILNRELGLLPVHDYNYERLVVSNFQAHEAHRVKPLTPRRAIDGRYMSPNVNHAFPIPSWNQILIADGTLVERCDWDNLNMDQNFITAAQGFGFPADTIQWSVHDDQVICGYASKSSLMPSRPMIELIAYDAQRTTRSSNHYSGKPMQGDITAIALTFPRAVVSDAATIFCADLRHGGVENILGTLSCEKEPQCLDFHSHNIVVAGLEKNVLLWDVRIDRSTTRIRHDLRTTGVKSFNDGTQILVADNHGMKLYDLRMTSGRKDRFPLAFRGYSEGKCCFDVKSGLVAAWLDSQVKVLSLRQGKEIVKRDARWQSEFRRVNAISWCEDARGSPYVQLCHDRGILRLAHGDQRHNVIMR